ncbi:MAG: hypothetical protein JXB04_00055 [Kiritimatiellae bacterium]|nr:hypothetical protein [Kiritimatiellia bacterium]
MKLKDILRDREKGSGELLNDTVAWLERHPDTLDEMQIEFTLALLRKTRPAMAGFALLADRIESGLAECMTLSPREVLHDISRSIEIADRKLAARFVETLTARGPGRAVTLSYSSAVLKAVGAAGDLIPAVSVLESHPGGEGVRLYEVLSDAREGVSLVPDEKLSEAAGQADFGLIGADTVFSDGAVLNKVLSLKLAEELKRHKKPLYALATEWKRATGSSADYRPDAQDRELFEVVPSELITAIITD